MTFINPSALWGLFLLLIPILIHLFSFRRYKKVLFSNLAFLVDVKEQKKSSSKLKRIIVLISRLLVLFFVILAFAQPIIKGDDEVYESNLVYLDNSFSMQQTDATGEPLLFRANALLEKELSNTKLGQQCLLTNNKTSKIGRRQSEVNVGTGFSSSTIGAEELINKADLYNSDVVKIYSDFQKSTFKIEELIGDSSRTYELYQIQSGNSTNLYIDTVYLSKAQLESGEGELAIVVKNSGPIDKEGVLIKLQKDNLQIASNSIAISANSESEVRFPIANQTNIYGAYTVQLQDVPVVFDNTFYFNIQKPEKTDVLILTEGIQTSKYINNVYSNEGLFSVTENDISATSLNILAEADLVVLNEISSIPEWLIGQLSNISSKFLLIPGKEIDMESYARFLNLVVKESPSDIRYSLSQEVLSHPIFEGVLLKEDNEANLPEVLVQLEMSGYFETILQTNAKQPYLIKTNQVYCLAAPLSDDVTNFHKHSIFVPVMYELAKSSLKDALYVRLGTNYVSVSSDSVRNESVFRLSSSEESFIPAYRYNEDRVVLEIPENLNEPGLYYLSTDKDTLTALAFNYSSLESEILTHSSVEIEKMISGTKHIQYMSIGSEAYAEASIGESDALSLWKYALLLALSFLLVESILLRFLK